MAACRGAGPGPDEPVQAVDQVIFTLPLSLLGLDFSGMAARSKFVVQAPASWPLGAIEGALVIIAAADRMGLCPWSAGAKIMSSHSWQQAD
jgi:hypothetical protein